MVILLSAACPTQSETISRLMPTSCALVIKVCRKYGYNEYIKIFETYPDCVFTPPIRQKKSLEDCFNEKDNVKYFTSHKRTDGHSDRKIDIDKIKQATEFEEETIKNFEQLFSQLGIPKLDDTEA